MPNPASAPPAVAAQAAKKPAASAALFRRALLWLVLCCALLPFVYALGFLFPRGDDFDEVTRAMFLFDLPGGLYEVGREWITWSGRYTYHFLAVFLGKAGELRWVYGLVCGGVMALYGVAFSGLARQAGARAGDAALLGGFAILALCACHQNLPAFYLLTDALTMGLQPAAALLFFWSLCRFWTALDRDGTPGAGSPRSAAPVSPGARRARRAAILLGVLAVGVFEHAALAVLLGAGMCCILALARDARHGLSLKGALRGPGRLRAALPVALWCLGAALFSFLAPGNQHRRSVRGIDAAVQGRQLDAVWSDWTDAVAAFGHSLWPVAVAGLVALLLLARRPTPTAGSSGLSRGESLLLAVMAPVGFLVWSLGLTVLHALSDVPLSAAPKLSAGLGQYAGYALGFALYALAGACRAAPPPARPRAAARAAFLLLALGLAALFCRSDNFLRTAANAANGSMVLLADAQETRDAWLRHAGEAARAGSGPRFGLIGEILHPGARSRRLDPTLPLVVVQREAAVFPVYTSEALPENPEHWPNLWAAWMYGVGGVSGARPDPARAVAAVAGLRAPDARRAGGPTPLALPEALRRHGVEGAWRVTAPGGPDPTFADTWLVLACRQALPARMALFRPNPPDWRRLAPLPAQAWLLRRLERQTPPDAAFPDFADRCAGTLLRFSTDAWATAAETGFFYAFPLGSRDRSWPLPLFVRPDGHAAWSALEPEGDDSPSTR